nr:pentatricopeptide repeat-containing protein At1g03540 [Ipomoea batatas]
MEGITGDVTLNLWSVAGNVEVYSVLGNVFIEGVGGDIDMDDRKRKIDHRGVNDDVSVEELQADVVFLEKVTGDVNVEFVVGQVSMVVVKGLIDVLSINVDVSVETVKGDVYIYGSICCDFDFQTKCPLTSVGLIMLMKLLCSSRTKRHYSTFLSPASRESEIIQLCNSGHLLKALKLLNSLGSPAGITAKPILYATLVQGCTKANFFQPWPPVPCPRDQGWP